MCQRDIWYNSYLLAVQQAFEKGDAKTALEICDVVIKSRRLYIKSFIAALVSRGRAHRMLGDFDKAVEDLDSVTEKEPNNGMAFNELALVFLDTKNPGRNISKGLGFAKKSYELDRSPANTQEIAKMFKDARDAEFKDGNYGEAIALTDRFLSIQGLPLWYRAIALYDKGTSFVKLNKHDKAVEEFTKAAHSGDVFIDVPIKVAGMVLPTLVASRLPTLTVGPAKAPVLR